MTTKEALLQFFDRLLIEMEIFSLGQIDVAEEDESRKIQPACTH